MRAAIIILSSLVFFALCFSVEAKVPTIPLQFNATLQFRFHGSDVVGQIFQDRQKLNRTRYHINNSQIYNCNFQLSGFKHPVGGCKETPFMTLWF